MSKQKFNGGSPKAHQGLDEFERRARGTDSPTHHECFPQLRSLTSDNPHTSHIHWRDGSFASVRFQRRRRVQALNVVHELETMTRTHQPAGSCWEASDVADSSISCRKL
jgi:hypothetical protein